MSFDVTGRSWRGAWERRRLKNRVVKALTLARRGAVANDSLFGRSVSLSLKVEWCARDVHPWDRDLSAEQKAEVFTAHLMADTVVAVRQMFDTLAEVDVIQIRVLDPHEPHQVVLAGTVCREDLIAAGGCPSAAMNLKLLGIQYV